MKFFSFHIYHQLLCVLICLLVINFVLLSMIQNLENMFLLDFSLSTTNLLELNLLNEIINKRINKFQWFGIEFANLIIPEQLFKSLDNLFKQLISLDPSIQKLYIINLLISVPFLVLRQRIMMRLIRKDIIAPIQHRCLIYNLFLLFNIQVLVLILLLLLEYYVA